MVFFYVVHKIFELLDFLVGKTDVDTSYPRLEMVVRALLRET